MDEYEIGYTTGKKMLNFSGASPEERAAARRLMAFQGTAEDVAMLEPLATMLGLPWRELFPEVCR